MSAPTTDPLARLVAAAALQGLPGTMTVAAAVRRLRRAGIGIPYIELVLPDWGHRTLTEVADTLIR